jgi:hypothetical protein
MAHLVACPECKKTLQVPDDLLGSNVQCPECKHTFIATTDPVESATPTGTTASPPIPGKPPAWEKKEEENRPRRRRDYDEEHEEENDRPRRRSPVRRGHFMPHRGGMILAFGIIGICALPIFGVVAWIMGNNDLRDIHAGRMDPEGESMTQTGRILGMIATILGIVGVLIGCGVFAFYLFCLGMFFAAAAGGAAKQQQNFPQQKR